MIIEADEYRKSSTMLEYVVVVIKYSYTTCWYVLEKIQRYFRTVNKLLIPYYIDNIILLRNSKKFSYSGDLLTERKYVKGFSGFCFTGINLLY